MMKQRLFTLIAAMIGAITIAQAQNLVVYGVTGKVETVLPNGSKHVLKLRETLSEQDVINLPYGAMLEVLDTESRKQYTLRQPGKAKLENMLSDRRNSVLKLTSKYFDYVIAQVKGKGQVKSRRVSDPATVTREVMVADSMYIMEPDSTTTDNK